MTQPDACGWCYDQGVLTSPGLLVSVMGVETFVEMELRKTCRQCGHGLDGLLRWQDEQGCNCEYGRSLQTLYLGEFCQECEEGRALARAFGEKLAAIKQARLVKLIANAGLTRELQAKTFDSFATSGSQELQGVKERVIDAAIQGRSLLLIGDTGTGKSHLAAAYLNLAIEQGRAGVFVSLIELMASLKKTIRQENGPGWDAVLEQYVESDLLVLDDLGQEKATDSVREVVFHLLNSRINRNLPTVVTSNYSLKELVEVAGYSPAIKSRLASFERVAWATEDYRVAHPAQAQPKKPALAIVDPWGLP